jgi:hypothetical protein
VAREVLRRIIEPQIGDISRSLKCVRDLPVDLLAELIARSDLRAEFAKFARELDTPEESCGYVEFRGAVNDKGAKTFLGLLGSEPAMSVTQLLDVVSRIEECSRESFDIPAEWARALFSE